MNNDPFSNLPHLRGKVTPPEASALRATEEVLAAWDRRARELGRPDNWRLPDDLREASRRELLANHDTSQDLWVYAYGSLMWDPGFYFSELRIARLDGYVRRFTCRARVGRGTSEHPALFLSLERRVGTCDGLAFRIPKASIETETAMLWRREMLVGAYTPTLVEIRTDQGDVQALAFSSNQSHPDYAAEMSLPDTAAVIATASGPLGTNLEYLESLAAQLVSLQIDDMYVFDLLRHIRSSGA